jgi:hypothetical protein
MVLVIFTDVPSVTASIVPSVTVGNSVVINCVVTAEPQETAIVWQKVINGVRTTLSISSNNRYSGGTVNTPSLTIGNVQDSDEGLYICQATNSVGTGSSNQVSLDVIGGKFSTNSRKLGSKDQAHSKI